MFLIIRCYYICRKSPSTSLLLGKTLIFGWGKETGWIRPECVKTIVRKGGEIYIWCIRYIKLYLVVTRCLVDATKVININNIIIFRLTILKLKWSSLTLYIQYVSNNILEVWYFYYVNNKFNLTWIGQVICIFL